MINKFNKQLENIKHNELILESRITQINSIIESNNEWKTILLVKNIYNQLILLTMNLNEIITEIETSLTFCNLNKIHSSIISLEELKRLINPLNGPENFWEITQQISSHCRLENNKIEYLLEIPVYSNNAENKLLQITPIPTIYKDEMFMLDENKHFLLQDKTQLYLTENCNKIKNNFYCSTNYVESSKCLNQIINSHKNENCKYHKVSEAFIISKIENSNLIIIASKDSKNLNIKCEEYTKHKIVKGIFRFKTNKNCIMNNFKLQNYVTNSKEIIFENLNFNIKTEQLSNKTVTLKQLNKQDIKIKEIPLLDEFLVDDNKYHILSNTVMINFVISALLTVCLCAFIYRDKLKKLCNNQFVNEHIIGEVPF